LRACNTETVHRLRDQRAASLPLHAKEQELSQVSRLEARRLDALRVLYYGYDRHEHHYTHDEGALALIYLQPVTNVHHHHHVRLFEVSNATDNIRYEK